MVIKEYKDAQSFLNDYETVMLKQESVSQLVLYAARHYNCDGDEKAAFGVVLKDEKAVLLYANVLPHDLVIYAVILEDVLQASITLATFLGENHVTVQGVLARKEIGQSFIEEYCKHMNCSFAEKMGMDIMEIREVNDIKPVDGFYRLAIPEEAKLVARWMIEFQMEALTSEMDYEAALQRAEKQILENKVHLYEDSDHNTVSMAISARKLVHGITIVYIYTPEEYRGKGYAAANIYYLSKELLEQGFEFCSLFVDKNNPLSSRAYEKVGYKTVGENYEFKLVLSTDLS